MAMARKSAKLPQWWLDCTPHDTLEDQVERKKKEAAERKEKEEAKKDEHQLFEEDTAAAVPSDPLVGLLVVKKSPQSTIQISRSPTGGHGSTRGAGGTHDYETTDYNEERAKLKPVAIGNNGDLGLRSPIRVKYSPGNEVENVKPISSPVRVEQMEQSPLSEKSPCYTPPRLRTYKTAFTGAGAFDFAMQQRAQEIERREKERQARESLKQHSANTMEAERVRQQKQKDLEMRRKKQEAQENLKGFKILALDSKMDKSTELKRQQLEYKRQTKEAEEKHHEYKLTT